MKNEEIKIFSQKDHDDNDPLTDIAFRKLFEGTKYTVIHHPHKEERFETGERIGLRGIDYGLQVNGKLVCYVDAERKVDWKQLRYPFHTVHFLTRKAKYAEGQEYHLSHCHGLPTYWVLFNHDCTGHLLIRISEAVACPQVRCDTRAGTKKEPFYDIPLDHVKLNRLSKIK